MRVCIIAVPYDSGIRGVRMGLGPDRLIESGLARRLRAEGHVVDVVVTELAPSHPAEIASSFELMASVAERVRKALAGGCFPVVLSGNCSASVGVLAALDEPRLIWLAAHADFESPDETTSGFLDGMALSILAGRCWHSMAAEIEGFSPIPGKRVALVGARDVSAAEEAALAKFGVLRISSEEVRNADGLARFTAFAEEARLVHIHLDLDVLDPAYGRANSFAAPGGIAPSELPTSSHTRQGGRALRLSRSRPTIRRSTPGDACLPPRRTPLPPRFERRVAPRVRVTQGRVIELSAHEAARWPAACNQG